MFVTKISKFIFHKFIYYLKITAIKQCLLSCQNIFTMIFTYNIVNINARRQMENLGRDLSAALRPSEAYRNSSLPRSACCLGSV